MADKSCQLIEALENDWRDALCSKDLDRLRSLVHPDFVLIGTRSSGPFTMGRDEWLDAIQRRDVDSIELAIRDATVLEHVMIGTIEAKWRLKYLGRVIEDCVLLTDVWVLEDGQWRALRRHSTPAPCANSTDTRRK
ncbi:nuclear transport factor 2 family protein [Sphingomonas hankyongi]|uniref:Nuclear transport factor 2 family protein n=1 Tax=Sphingomonas hankyongi TaxID=2908209 RepID=A0ABT0S1X2_9SPHN|nr:nuclear transport factor 2 family protein [Sphingomonas hankyongi]